MGPTTILSPPPPRRNPKPLKENYHLRLRSDSGMSLHTNQLVLRQYTDYNSKGSLRPPTPRVRPLSYDGSTDAPSLGTRSSESKESPRPSGPLPDFFDPDVIKMAFSNKTTSQRLYQFAKSRHCAADMEFLMKVSPPYDWRQHILVAN